MMQNFGFEIINLKAGRGSLIVSAICLILNFLIGDTIFANVILVMISFFTALSVFLASLIGLFKADPNHRPIGRLIGSMIILAIIIGLVMTDNIAAGYGP